MGHNRIHKTSAHSHTSRPFFSKRSHYGESEPFFSKSGSSQPNTIQLQQEEDTQPDLEEIQPQPVETDRETLQQSADELPLLPTAPSSPTDPQDQTFIQAKLTVSQPNGTYGQEADRPRENIELPVQRQQGNEEEIPDVIQPKPSTKLAMLSVQRQTEEEINTEVVQSNPLQNSSKAVFQHQSDANGYGKNDRPNAVRTNGSNHTSTQLPSGINTSQNQTGMPEQLKTGLEALSGRDLSDVRVHRNSSKPAEVNALAYAQGQDIHVAPGQENHLPHEGWHVIQQMQGRVQPTMQAKGNLINDDQDLEREADEMGAAALEMGSVMQTQPASTQKHTNLSKLSIEANNESEALVTKPQTSGKQSFLSNLPPIQRQLVIEVGKQYVIRTKDGDNLRLRVQPTPEKNLGGDIKNPNTVGNIKSGTTVTVIEKRSYDWYVVKAKTLEHGERVGFVNKKYLTQASTGLTKPSGTQAVTRPSEIPKGGKLVNKVGIIQWDGKTQVRLRSTPDTTSKDNILTGLPFNTRLEIIKEFSNGWLFVTTEDGKMGYLSSNYVWGWKKPHLLPEPTATLHRVDSGIKGFAISIAERFYGVDRYKFGQDLRFYVGVLAYVNKKEIPKTTNGWKQTSFDAGALIWIPSLEFARSLKGTVNSGSYTYNLAESLGLAEFLQKAGQKQLDIRNAITLSKKYLAAAVKRHAVAAFINALVSLAYVIVIAVGVLAVSTAIGAAIGAIFGGVGAAPGAATGFKVGLFILKWLGLGFLIYWIGNILVKVGRAFAKFFSTVWNANGDGKKLNQGAQEFAEAIGILIGVILEVIIILVASWGLARSVSALSKTKFGKKIGSSKLGRWMKDRLNEIKEGQGKDKKQSKPESKLVGNSGKKYQTKEMLSKYKGEETGSIWGSKVRYLNESQRAALEIFVKDGKLVNHKGKTINTTDASSVFRGGEGRAIFVMDGKGRIFISKFQKVGEFHHSSFLAGKPVASAGEMVVVDGVLSLVTARSGHYQPMMSLARQVLAELGARGVDVSNVKFEKGF